MKTQLQESIIIATSNLYNELIDSTTSTRLDHNRKTISDYMSSFENKADQANNYIDLLENDDARSFLSTGTTKNDSISDYNLFDIVDNDENFMETDSSGLTWADVYDELLDNGEDVFKFSEYDQLIDVVQEMVDSLGIDIDKHDPWYFDKNILEDNLAAIGLSRYINDAEKIRQRLIHNGKGVLSFGKGVTGRHEFKRLAVSFIENGHTVDNCSIQKTHFNNIAIKLEELNHNQHSDMCFIEIINAVSHYMENKNSLKNITFNQVAVALQNKLSIKTIPDSYLSEIADFYNFIANGPSDLKAYKACNNSRIN